MNFSVFQTSFWRLQPPLSSYIYIYNNKGNLAEPYVLENIGKMYINIYELDPANFILALLAWHAALKTTVVKLELLTEINMSPVVEKGIKGRMSCNSLLCESE